MYILENRKQHGASVATTTATKRKEVPAKKSWSSLEAADSAEVQVNDRLRLPPMSACNPGFCLSSSCCLVLRLLRGTELCCKGHGIIRRLLIKFVLKLLGCVHSKCGLVLCYFDAQALAALKMWS